MSRFFNKLRAPLQAAAISAAADTTVQCVVQQRSLEQLDTRRTLSFAVFSFAYGGLFACGIVLFALEPILVCPVPSRRTPTARVTRPLQVFSNLCFTARSTASGARRRR